MIPFWEMTVVSCSSLKYQLFDLSLVWIHYQNQQLAPRTPGSGPPSVTTTREDRYMCLHAQRYRSSSTHQLSSSVVRSTGMMIYQQTTGKQLMTVIGISDDHQFGSH
ncbi:hypothetical protein TNCV_866661 [Trichonephila clavipes]|nr:hypothetical protein TNCV_866661 [Trichonephila clavipes]